MEITAVLVFGMTMFLAAYKCTAQASVFGCEVKCMSLISASLSRTLVICECHYYCFVVRGLVCTHRWYVA